MIAANANDNCMSAEEIVARCDWVRPVAAAMRAAALPEPVVQRAMTRLLEELDRFLDGDGT
jgi:uncharacterized heparinase superfamily protein